MLNEFGLFWLLSVGIRLLAAIMKIIPQWGIGKSIRIHEDNQMVGFICRVFVIIHWQCDRRVSRSQIGLRSEYGLSGHGTLPLEVTLSGLGFRADGFMDPKFLLVDHAS